jgi:hypothetical protein
MRIVAFIFFSLIGISAAAQDFPFELWHEGKLILDSGDTLRGSIKYDLQNDLIQYQLNAQSKPESYTARKVLFFEIFDATVKRYRAFYSLPYAIAGQYKAPVFFELMEEGKITLLCREFLEYRTTSSGLYYYGSYTRLVLINKYFLLKENGEIEEYTGKKNDWYDLMKGRESEVQKYVKANRLDLDDKYELSQAVHYYNSLFQKN